MVAGMDSGHGYDWANGQINYGTENYFNLAHGMTSHTYLYPASGSQSAAIRQNVSDGISFGNYTAHCSASGWGDPSFNTSHIPALQNQDKYCLLVGNCCSSSAFNANACFAEALLRAEDKGALGYIGGSNSTYWDEDYYFGVGVGPISEDPPSYEETSLGYYDRTFHDHGEPFSEWYTTQDQMIFGGNLAVTEGVPGSSLYYWEIYCLMGDPSLMIYFSQPDPLTVSYNPTVPLGTPSFTITTEPYAYAAVSMNGALISADLADENGMAVLDLSSAAAPGEADVVITKQNAQPYFGTVMIQNPDGPYVILSEYNLTDTSSGNGNGQADYGENVKLEVELENIGSEDAEDVSATITTESPWVTITDDYELFGTIPVSTAVMKPEAYAFNVADSIPDQESVLFELTIQDSTRLTWNSSLSVTLNAPVLAFGEVMVIDTLNGNSNGRLDAGELAEILVGVRNDGHSDALNAVMELTSASADVTINNAIFNVDSIPASGEVYAVFNVTVSEGVPTGTTIGFSKMAEAGAYAIEDEFYLVAGQIPVLVLDFDKNHNSADAIITCLENLGVAAELHMDFPEDMGMYMSAFVCLGIYDDNYVLSGSDGEILANYLNSGGMLYMEGGDTWYYDQQTDVHPMFRIDGIADGTDDLSTILGTITGFCTGMSFNYTGDNNYIDHIENIDSAFLLFENSPEEYFNGVAYDAGTYKTIGVSFEFGGLEDGEYTKDELMQSFLDFFGIESLATPVGEIPAENHLAMTIYPNPASAGNSNFRISTSRESHINLRLYNTMGQMLDDIKVSRIFSAGTHTIPVNTEHLKPGIYHCVLSSEESHVSVKLVKMKY
jgi:hypothetical protein